MKNNELTIFYKSEHLTGVLEKSNGLFGYGLSINIYNNKTGLDWFLKEFYTKPSNQSYETIRMHVNEVLGIDLSSMTQDEFEKFFNKFPISLASLIAEEDEDDILFIIGQVCEMFESIVFDEEWLHDDPHPENNVHHLYNVWIFPENYSSEVHQVVQNLVDQYRQHVLNT